MNKTAQHDEDIPIPLRGAPIEGWRWQDNEVSIVFQPIIGPAATALYCHLTGKGFGAPFKYTLRGLAEETGRGRATIWRAMSVLERIGMVRLRTGGGSQPSECSLVDLKKLAARLGASQDKKRASYVLAPCRVEELKSQIAALRNSMEVKHPTGNESQSVSGEKLARSGIASLFLLGSKRDASVSPERRQRSTRETQTGTHLLQEEGRNEKVPSPTPSHEEAQPKNSANEDGSDALLKCARDLFNGVIDDMRAHLLDTNKPPNSNLANGYADWTKFGFNGLAVEVAARRGEVLVLVLSAIDPAEARRGLDKYRKTWEGSFLNRFGGKVQIELQRRQA